MFAPARILAPVDFSDASDLALRRAADLATRTGAELHVLHVVPGISPEVVFDDLSSDDRAFYRRFFDEADATLTARFAWVDGDRVQAKRVISKGAPAQIILDYAEREQCDLLVMGTHGRRGLQRLFLGSVAEDVLRRTDIPVMIVPEHASGRASIRLVLAPTDFSDPSRWALAVAADFAALYGARLELLHALEPERFVEAITGAEIAAGLIPELRTEAERQLEAFAKASTLSEALAESVGVDEPVEGGRQGRSVVGYHVVEGRAAKTIAETARAHGADVIVLAKRGLHGVERLLLGSVTERVCRLAPCPILVLPIQDRAAD